MYLRHFGFQQQPFGATPDPAFLYFSPQHAEALAALHYGLLEGRGLMVLIAPPGLGKTTLLHHLLRCWRGRAETVYVFQPPESRDQLLAAVLGPLGLAPPASYAEGCRRLFEYALDGRRRGKRLLLVIDEAHCLSADLLERIRQLSNLEQPDRKLLDIVLAGQPTLAEQLGMPAWEPLRQRVAIVTSINRLDADEVRRYVEHRLRLAGRAKGRLLTRRAIRVLGHVSHGVPRTINAICFEALSGAFAGGKRRIDDREILRAAVAVGAIDAAASAQRLRAMRWAAGAAALLLGALAPPAYLHWQSRQPATAAAAATEGTRRVQVGPSDTLPQIALRHYGRWDDSVWMHLRKHNPWLLNADHLRPGQVLLLPPWEASP